MSNLDDSTQHLDRLGLLAYQALQSELPEDDGAVRTTSNQWRFLLGGIAALSLFGSPPAFRENNQTTGRAAPYVSFEDETGHVISPLSAEFASRNSLADQVVCELGRLRAGWAGAGSVAPKNETLNDVETVLNLLPSSVATPTVDVDHEDGSVAVRWVRSDRSASFSLVFRGDRRATAVVATLSPPKSRSRSIAIANEAEMASLLETQVGDFASA